MSEMFPERENREPLTPKDLKYTPEGVRKIVCTLMRTVVLEQFNTKEDEVFAQLVGFNPIQFADGISDAILTAAESSAALAYNLYAHPAETIHVLAQDLKALKDPDTLAVLLAADSVKEWWEKNQEEGWVHRSYHMGFAIGVAGLSLGTKRLGTLGAAPGEFDPALGPKTRTDLMSEMFTTSALQLVQEKMPSAVQLVRPILGEMHKRIQETENPLVLKAFSQTMNDLHLHHKYPTLLDQLPIKRSSVVFLRNQLVESLYTLTPSILSPASLGLLVGGLSIVLNQLSTSTTLNKVTLQTQAGIVELYFANARQAQAVQNSIPILNAIGRDLSTKGTTQKESFVALTDQWIAATFA